MRTKKVNRYYCDYCKKSGCAAGHMKRHESRCTMNPGRDCGVCGLTGETTPTDLPRLKELLPDPEDYRLGDKWGYPHFHDSFKPEVEKAIDTMRAISECPACIMAALRQCGIPVHIPDNFDFKKWMKEIFDCVNSERNAMVGAGDVY